MSNAYYTPTTNPQTGSLALSSIMRNEFALITQGFNLLPALSPGVANQFVLVNSGGTALVSSATLPIPVGSTSAPSIAFQGDLTTGFYQSAVGHINFSIENSLFADFTAAGVSFYESENSTFQLLMQNASTGASSVASHLISGGLVNLGLSAAAAGTVNIVASGSALTGMVIGTSQAATTLAFEVAGTNRLSSTAAGNWTIAAPTSGVALTITAGGATITAGGLLVTAGGVTVSAGGAAITGTSSVTGALSVTGPASATALGVTGGAGAAQVVSISNADTAAASNSALLMSNSAGSPYAISFQVQSTAGSYNPNVSANDQVLLARGTGTGTGVLNLTAWSGTGVGVRISGSANTVGITSGGTVAALFDAGSNQVFGNNAAALAAAATAGFLYLPQASAAPTGTPATTYTGSTPTVVDSSSGRVWSDPNSAWQPPLPLAGGGLTGTVGITNTVTPTSTGKTFNATAFAGGIWRIRANGTFTSANSATARNALIQVYWGSTLLTGGATPAVLVSTANTYGWFIDYLLVGVSTTSVNLTGTGMTSLTGSLGFTLALGSNSTTVTAGSQAIDLRFSMSVSVATDEWFIQNITYERIA